MERVAPCEGDTVRLVDSDVVGAPLRVSVGVPDALPLRPGVSDWEGVPLALGLGGVGACDGDAPCELLWEGVAAGLSLDVRDSDADVVREAVTDALPERDCDPVSDVLPESDWDRVPVTDPLGVPLRLCEGEPAWDAVCVGDPLGVELWDLVGVSEGLCDPVTLGERVWVGVAPWLVLCVGLGVLDRLGLPVSDGVGVWDCVRIDASCDADSDCVPEGVLEGVRVVEAVDEPVELRVAVPLREALGLRVVDWLCVPDALTEGDIVGLGDAEGEDDALEVSEAVDDALLVAVWLGVRVRVRDGVSDWLGLRVGVPLRVWLRLRLCVCEGVDDLVPVCVAEPDGVADTELDDELLGVSVPVLVAVPDTLGDCVIDGVSVDERLALCVWLFVAVPLALCVWLRVPEGLALCVWLAVGLWLRVADSLGVGLHPYFSARMSTLAYEASVAQVVPPSELAKAPAGCANPDAGVWPATLSTGSCQFRAWSDEKVSAQDRRESVLTTHETGSASCANAGAPAAIDADAHVDWMREPGTPVTASLRLSSTRNVARPPPAML